MVAEGKRCKKQSSKGKARAGTSSLMKVREGLQALMGMMEAAIVDEENKKDADEMDRIFQIR